MNDGPVAGTAGTVPFLPAFCACGRAGREARPIRRDCGRRSYRRSSRSAQFRGRTGEMAAWRPDPRPHAGQRLARPAVIPAPSLGTFPNDRPEDAPLAISGRNRLRLLRPPSRPTAAMWAASHRTGTRNRPRHRLNCACGQRDKAYDDRSALVCHRLGRTDAARFTRICRKRFRTAGTEEKPTSMLYRRSRKLSAASDP